MSVSLLVVLWCVHGPMTIQPTPTPIQLDGIIQPQEWDQAVVIDTFYETNPGDNIEPIVQTTGLMTYDSQYFYVALQMQDPNPKAIVAPLSDRDNVPSFTDYAGVFLDTHNEGKVSQMFLANPRGVQYDAISGDNTGEDSSPNFFWDVATKIHDKGWDMEIRIPFSSLRYEGSGPQTWRFMLYRNYPRDSRYQMFSNRLPRDRSCFICNLTPFEGLNDLPSGSHFVVAPYAFGSQSQVRQDDHFIKTEDPDGEPGLDLKWRPNPALAIDMTVNPDFSQIEADSPQITANERFALFFPENRPFFMEGVDLFSTPFSAVHTRSITDPSVGGRATGKIGDVSYTTLAALDEGGGSVIVPGSQGSEFADQDYESQVYITRLRKDMGKGFLSFLGTAREIEGGGHNRVIGPDFSWRPNDTDDIGAQVLWSQTQSPERTDLHETYDGREMDDFAAQAWFFRGTATWDYYLKNTYVGEDFRAENGFIPQVGYNETFGEIGHTWRPKERYLHRIRGYVFSEYTSDENDNLLYRLASIGFGASGKKNSFFRYRYARDTIRSGDELFDRDRLYFTSQINPSRHVGFLSINGFIGDEVDFVHNRLGDMVSFDINGDFLLSDSLKMSVTAAQRWLKVEDLQRSGRLFTATVARLRANYHFTARSYLRLISQYRQVKRDQALFLDEVDPESGDWSGSLLFAYKLNWQSVLFAGYGDNLSLEDQRWQTTDRNWFIKVSYAYQK